MKWRKWLFLFQQTVGLTERECRVILILSALIILGAGSRYFRGAAILFDDAYYAEADSIFNSLTRRANRLRPSVRPRVAGDADDPDDVPGYSTGINRPARYPSASAANRTGGMEGVKPDDPGHTSAPLLDINHASSEELQSLPGIGPAMAARIMRLRRELGSFRDPSDLLLVQGIGNKTLARLEPLVTVKAPGGEDFLLPDSTRRRAAFVVPDSS